MHQTTAFFECMYLHYDSRLTAKDIPEPVKVYFRQTQMMYAEKYAAASLLPLHQAISKLSKIVNHMSNNHTTAITPGDILHMAKLIEKRQLENEPCILHCSSDRIALTDSENIVIAWVKTKA